MTAFQRHGSQVFERDIPELKDWEETFKMIYMSKGQKNLQLQIF